MARAILGCLGIVLAGVGYLQAARLQPPSPAPSQASQYRALLDTYCVTCHNDTLLTAKLDLGRMDVANVGAGAEVWEKVVVKLRASAMPPAGLPRPDKATYNGFATYLETELDRAAAARLNPGRPAVHRLNRAEYTNAIRDLLALDIDGESLLPADDPGYGFDNIADVLSVSPMLLETYMTAARKISSLAVGDPTIRPTLSTYTIPRLLTQDDRVSEDLPFGSRGGAAIRHHFPLDGDYVLKIKLAAGGGGQDVLGSAERHPIDVRVNGERIKLLAFGAESKDEEYSRRADENLEVRFTAKAGTHVVGVTFPKAALAPEGTYRPKVAGGDFRFDYKAVDPMLDRVTIDGPYDATGAGDTSSRRRVFVCRPTGSQDEDACARQILSTLARRAYRRPVTEQDTQALLTLYRAEKSDGFEAGIQFALRKILMSPEFLFRIERDPATVTSGTAYRLSDLELASRLSFFLWSSIPDDQLLDVAAKGKLKEPAVLEQQVRRMLADPRSNSLVSNFGAQWLHLRNLRVHVPDPGEFPEFDENLREAFQKETELFLESTIREDRPIPELLNADYTFVNERLARLYEIPNIYGNRFRRVTLTDPNRRGLLGHGSILSVTSFPTRTSPTMRGKWVLENILGMPPPPPPDVVPALADRSEEGKIVSVRQQLEQHRKNPACAVCHRVMDPLGFALDNFDGIGRWRTISGIDKAPVDASGELPDGTRFKGIAELRPILMNRREEFVTNVTKKLLTYALGRGLEVQDMPAVRWIKKQAVSDEYRWSSLILGIVKSTPFQMRKAAERTTVTAGLR